MQATVSQELCARALAIVGRAVGSGTGNPSLSHVLLDVADGQLAFHATDSRTAIRYTIPLTTHTGRGQLLLPARLLTEVVGAVPTGTLTLTTDDAHPTTVALTGGPTSATLRGLPVIDFPRLPDLSGDVLATLPVETLRTGIPTVTFAAARDGKQPVLNAVLLQVTATQVILVATDGLRLAERRLPLPNPAGATPAAAAGQLLIPPAALDDLAAILTGVPFSGPTPSATSVTITRGSKGNLVTFSAGGLLLVTRLVDGTFPDYTAMVPTSHQTRVVLASHTLRDAVRLAAAFTADKHQMVTLHPQTANGSTAAGLTVDGESNERGASSSSLAATVDSAEAPPPIYLHAGFVLQALGTFPGQVALELNGPTRPGILRALDDNGPLQLIMPMTKAA